MTTINAQADPYHLVLDKLAHPLIGENGIPVPNDCNQTDSETEAELSDIPSNDSANETDEEQPENQLDSDEVRFKLKKLAGHGGTYIRRKSVVDLIPNWPTRNEEAFKRGKEVVHNERSSGS